MLESKTCCSVLVKRYLKTLRLVCRLFFFFFLPIWVHTDLHYQLYSAGWPLSIHSSICLAWQKHCLTLHTNFSTQFFHTWHAYRHHLLLPFYTTFSDLDTGGGGGGTRSAQSQTCWLHFLTYSSTDWDEIWWWSNSSWTSRDDFSEIY